MKYFIALSIFFLGVLTANAQETGRIIHYLSKCKSCEIPLPGHTFNKVGLRIFFPDSIYDSGDITIKKLRSSDLKLKKVKYSFEKGSISAALLYASSDKHFERFINYVMLNSKSNDLGDFMSVKGLKKMSFSTDQFSGTAEKTGGKWMIKLLSTE